MYGSSGIQKIVMKANTIIDDVRDWLEFKLVTFFYCHEAKTPWKQQLLSLLSLVFILTEMLNYRKYYTVLTVPNKLDMMVSNVIQYNFEGKPVIHLI